MASVKEKLSNLWSYYRWLVLYVAIVLLLCGFVVLWKLWVRMAEATLVTVNRDDADRICGPDPAADASFSSSRYDSDPDYQALLRAAREARARHESSGSSLPSTPRKNEAGQSAESQFLETSTIYRGRDANIQDWPFLVAIGYHGWPNTWLKGKLTDKYQQPRTFCTGSLISPEWVLTAGHCVGHFMHQHWVTGGTDCRPEFGGILRENARRVRVSRIERYQIRGMTVSRSFWLPKWESNRVFFMAGTKYSDKDIALLRLEEPLTAGADEEYIKPIQMEGSGRVANLDDLKVAGWGGTHYSNEPERLKEYSPGAGSVLSDPVRDRHSFDRMLPYRKSQCRDAHLLVCIKAGFDQPQFASGDSGGPVVGKSSTDPNEWLQLGVISGGDVFFENRKREVSRSDEGNAEEDEPHYIHREAPRRGPRPGVGVADYLAAVRVRTKLSWIDEVRTGIPVWKRIFNGIWLVCKCIWYALTWGWLDGLYAIFWHVIYLFRDYRRGGENLLDNVEEGVQEDQV